MACHVEDEVVAVAVLWGSTHLVGQLLDNHGVGQSLELFWINDPTVIGVIVIGVIAVIGADVCLFCLMYKYP
jgi:hypothetical protein